MILGRNDVLTISQSINVAMLRAKHIATDVRQHPSTLVLVTSDILNGYKQKIKARDGDCVSISHWIDYTITKVTHIESIVSVYDDSSFSFSRFNNRQATPIVAIGQILDYTIERAIPENEHTLLDERTDNKPIRIEQFIQTHVVKSSFPGITNRGYVTQDIHVGVNATFYPHAFVFVNQTIIYRTQRTIYDPYDVIDLIETVDVVHNKASLSDASDTVVANQTINPATYVPDLLYNRKISFTGNNLTLQLRPPAFSDKYNYTERRVNRNTRGNDLIIYADLMWPYTELMDMIFEFLNETQKTQVENFLLKNIGTIITYTDQFNKVFRGIILNPEERLQASGPNMYKWSVRIQGDYDA